MSDRIREQYDAIVIGGGKGGKTLAIELGHEGVRVALIERSEEMIGGSCINVACIPTKTLIASARMAHSARRAAAFGVKLDGMSVDWLGVRRRAEAVVTAMRSMNHKNFTSTPNLDFILGAARFVEPHVVEVRAPHGGVHHLTAEKIIINTGTRPAQPVLPGLAEIGPLALDSESIQRLDALPRHLVVLGGGYVALEFAQMFRFFGSEVTVLERGARLLKREDADIVKALATLLREDGIDIRCDASAARVEKQGDDVAVILNASGQTGRVVGSHLLVAVGRKPNTAELNLAAAGVETDERGFVRVNERLETSVSGIWALGDVNGGPQFTHASLEDYRIVRANAFGGSVGRSRGDRPIPFTLFTEPELARIGLTEEEARRQGLAVKISKVSVAAIPRAKTMSESRGMIKVVVEAQSDRILGCAVLSVEGGEMLGAVQMAMTAGLPFAALRDMVFAHPTFVEGFNNLPVPS